ncbi:MAG: amino-acid N-acetyltransferase [Gammaproteobacteria bacterium]|nr:MAG: amino-acid N-acetyltransferase [Gammaproteobacteria bacterium]
MSKAPLSDNEQHVAWFRHSSPYIHAHRGRTFVIGFPGEAVEDAGFAGFIHDVALLSALGIRIVLVHGIRPQIERRLADRDGQSCYHDGLRVTDAQALVCVKEAAGSVRVELEALLSMGVANSPMAGARLRVAAGNFVTAKPLGVRDGIDFCHTGTVRRVDAEAIGRQLAEGAVVLLSPIGYSPTGEVFNLAYEEVASSVATTLRADKLICLLGSDGLRDPEGKLLRQLSPAEADGLTRQPLGADAERAFTGAVEACRNGVRRAHLVGWGTDGALLLELFTRDGVGTMITADPYDTVARATVDDIGGILELIEPLEQQGVLVQRSREQIEVEVERFTVLCRDGAIIGCGALRPFPEEGMGELACLAVHPQYKRGGRGELLLERIEQQARNAGLEAIFVLTTQTSHWFVERGFVAAAIEDLPMARKSLYNMQRNSKVYIKQM